MKLFIEKRPFSWEAKYSVFAENGKEMYKVQGVEGKKEKVITLFNVNEMELGKVVMKKPLIGSPKFEIILAEQSVGKITKDFTFAVTRWVLELSRWRVFGSIMSWEFDIMDEHSLVMHAGVEGTQYEGQDKYVLDISYDNNEIPALLTAIGMEAANSLQKR